LDFQEPVFKEATNMKTRLPRSLAALALALSLTAGYARAAAPCNDCNDCRKAKGDRLRSAHQQLKGHWQAKCAMHKARHDQCAVTPGRANCLAQQHAATEPWHGDYYHVMWGEPVALVVPPTMALQTHWNWGVAQTAITPVWHQYNRAYPGPFVAGGKGFRPTPRWPSSTDQFGVYYVRGPW
jgi:hypothetical protein